MKRSFRFLFPLLAILAIFVSCGKEKEPQEPVKPPVQETVPDSSGCLEVWTSTQATLNNYLVESESEAGIYMVLALFDDGIFHMDIEIDGESASNFPQEGSYSYNANGDLMLENGWTGTITDDLMRLYIEKDSDKIVFFCTRTEYDTETVTEQ